MNYSASGDSVTVSDHVLARELEGETILLNLNNETYYLLDNIGTRVWTLLTTCSSVERIYESLLAEYEVEPEVLRNDLEQLLNELQEEGLLERQDGAA